MSETTTQKQDAATELEIAERGVQEILDRIKDGDEQVGPEDLEAAESRVRFARARLEGEERRREEEAEKARTEHIDALRQRALALDKGHLRKLEEKARKALDAYVAAAVAYRTELNEVVQELSGFGSLPGDIDIVLGAEGHSLSVGSEHRPRELPITVCSRIAYDVLRAHLPRGHINLERPLG
jgi:hypothetical protein